MRTIGGVALGTYYAAGAQAAKATPNASAMRGLVYAVKDNRDPPNPKQFVAHPSHPSPRPVAVDRTNAIEYVTAILGRRIANLAKFFGARDPRAILRGFVRTPTPVPKSDVVVLVDDNVQSGNSLAALDHLLGGGRSTAAFAVSVTDAEACKDALKPRRFTIDYDGAAASLRVMRTLGPVR